MRVDLIINGVQADLDRKTKITVEFKSGILEDLTMFTGSYSFSFSLPKTTVNRRIFDGAGVPGHTSTAARKYNSALLLCDGVDILGGTGTAVLLSVSSGAFEVALVFDFAPGFQEWLDKGESIQDLPEISLIWKNEADIWGQLDEGEDMILQPLYRFSGFDYKKHADIFPHPVVREHYIVDQIMEQIGSPVWVDYTFVTAGSLHADDNENQIELGVPLPTRTPMHGEETLTFTAAAAALESRKIYFATGGSTDTGGLYDYTNRRFKVPEDAADLRLKGVFVTRARGFYASVILKASKTGNTYVDVATYTSAPAATSNQNAYISIDNAPDLKGYKYFYLELSSNTDGLSTKGFTVTASRELVQLGGTFGSHNLPDIKQSDFLAAALAMRCAVLRTARKENGTPYLTYFHRADLYDRTRAVDWSAKLLGSLEPEKMELSLDGFARLNRYRWKENKNHDTTAADGAFNISDETLDSEADIYEMPEQAPEVYGYDRLAVVDFYKAKTDNAGVETVELQDTDPYLCAIGADPLSYIPDAYKDEYKQYAIMTFPDALKWSSILAGPYWADFVKTLQNPMKIEAYLRLGVTDLASLDFSRSIYLEQFGQYFAVLSVRFDSSKGISKATLLKL